MRVINQLTETALVLIGHGSTVNAQSAEPVYQHAATVRRLNQFAQVCEAFWKQEPQIEAVLSSITEARVFIVPVFISEGYFSDQIIPQKLGFQVGKAGELSRVKQRANQTLFYCKPVGTHPRMTEVLLARARGIVRQFPFPREPAPADTTMFIAGHGTEQNENSRKAIERQVELIRAMHLYADIHAVYLEEDPRIAQCYTMATTKNIVVVPFLISDGMHVSEDIPALLGEPQRIVKQRLQNGQPAWRNPTERKDKLVWYSSSVGTDPLIPEVILDRVREAASTSEVTTIGAS
jgi:sirohydrochlorin cobaltochelatase